MKDYRRSKPLATIGWNKPRSGAAGSGVIEGILDRGYEWIESRSGSLSEGKESRIKYSVLIPAFLVLLLTILIYTWSHMHITELKYKIAREIKAKESLLEENNKLKVEISMLKSPRRIESIARGKLGMNHPDKEQVIILK
jgi:cell division protein FtsL